LGTVAAKAGDPNGLGLRHAVGNVWEWCADWFSAAYYLESPRDDPPGPPAGSERVMRGGSYLCHDSYCRRYRVSARTGNTPDSSAGNVGFRCAIDCTTAADNGP
jgi:formylglycine-generating enzyme